MYHFIQLKPTQLTSKNHHKFITTTTPNEPNRTDIKSLLMIMVININRVTSQVNYQGRYLPEFLPVEN